MTCGNVGMYGAEGSRSEARRTPGAIRKHFIEIKEWQRDPWAPNVYLALKDCYTLISTSAPRQQHEHLQWQYVYIIRRAVRSGRHLSERYDCRKIAISGTIQKPESRVASGTTVQPRPRREPWGERSRGSLVRHNLSKLTCSSLAIVAAAVQRAPANCSITD